MTDKEYIEDMLRRTDTRIAVGPDYIEILHSEVTFWFKRDGSLNWVNNDRYAGAMY